MCHDYRLKPTVRLVLNDNNNHHSDIDLQDKEKPLRRHGVGASGEIYHNDTERVIDLREPYAHERNITMGIEVITEYDKSGDYATRYMLYISKMNVRTDQVHVTKHMTI
jgi:hypothetical protein